MTWYNFKFEDYLATGFMKMISENQRR